MRTHHCVRSGFCCQVATCAEGVRLGAPLKGCTFLLGDKPGEYSCQLVKTHPERMSWSIGQGCSSTMFNTARNSVFQRMAEGDLPELLESLVTLTEEESRTGSTTTEF